MAKKNYSLAALIGTGALNLVHTASHVIPALGALGAAANSHSHVHDREVAELGYLVSQNQPFLEHAEQILSHPVMQVAYLAFVPLSFMYILKDHKQHRHHESLEGELSVARTRIAELESRLDIYSNI